MPVGWRAWLITIVVGLLVVLPFKFLFNFPLWLAVVLAAPVGIVAMFVGIFILVNRKQNTR